jgi:hypothetical protein
MWQCPKFNDIDNYNHNITNLNIVYNNLRIIALYFYQKTLKQFEKIVEGDDNLKHILTICFQKWGCQFVRALKVIFLKPFYS